MSNKPTILRKVKIADSAKKSKYYNSHDDRHLSDDEYYNSRSEKNYRDPYEKKRSDRDYDKVDEPYSSSKSKSYSDYDERNIAHSKTSEYDRLKRGQRSEKKISESEEESESEVEIDYSILRDGSMRKFMKDIGITRARSDVTKYVKKELEYLVKDFIKKLNIPKGRKTVTDSDIKYEEDIRPNLQLPVSTFGILFRDHLLKEKNIDRISSMALENAQIIIEEQLRISIENADNCRKNSNRKTLCPRDFECVRSLKM